MSEKIEEVKKSLTEMFDTSIKQSEKQILDQQLLKEENKKKMKELVEKVESSNSELMKALQDLRTEAHSWKTQYSTKFEKQLDDANTKIKELTDAQSASEIIKFADELQNTNSSLTDDLVTRLKTALQPLINFADRMTRTQSSQSRPPVIAQHDPSAHPSQGGEVRSSAILSVITASEATLSETTTTTAITTTTTTYSKEKEGTESLIAPHMEQVHRARSEYYKKMLKINAFALENGNEKESIFTIADFPIMNPHDFIVILELMRDAPGHAAETMMIFNAARNHVIELLQWGDNSRAYGVVLKGLKNDNEIVTKIFEVDYKGLYPSALINNMITAVNTCQASPYEEKKKFMEHMAWWMGKGIL
ncbi:hypothetical protein L2E82_49838 [Cichorium intybus]|uniref:Uncharacterized protein n=1 Tax=Cichorium intybus TaxID=13427 RepID=A0ACB8Z0F8_CICIN|nr:hypothetical protein L2E82_49838 [Cichorium intybus]